MLGPGSDAMHYNHFHLDLAMHGNTSRGLRRICRPQPQRQNLPPRRDNLPDPPELEPDLDVARNMGRGPMVAQGYNAARPGIAMQPERLRSMPRPQAPIGPASAPAPAYGGGDGVYGRLQPGAGQPLQLDRSVPRGTGIMHDDGIFVPPEGLAD